MSAHEEIINELRMLETYHTAAANLATGLRKKLEKGLPDQVPSSSNGQPKDELDAIALDFRLGCIKPKP